PRQERHDQHPRRERGTSQAIGVKPVSGGSSIAKPRVERVRLAPSAPAKLEDSLVARPETQLDDRYGRVQLGEIGSSFESIGTPTRIKENLSRRLNIKKPTPLQTALFPALISHRDVIVRDMTGSGKTLGIIAAILSKKHPPLYEAVDAKPTAEDPDIEFDAPDAVAALGPGKWRRRIRYLSTIFLTPTPELALQVYRWSRELLGDVPPSDMPKHVQCLIPESPVASQLDLLRTTTPRLLIGTPRRILEVLDLDRDAYLFEKEASRRERRELRFNPAIDLTMIQSVVIDETDAMVRVETRYETERERRCREEHPMYAEILMDRIVRMRRTAPGEQPLHPKKMGWETKEEEVMRRSHRGPKETRPWVLREMQEEEERKKAAIMRLKPTASLTRMGGRHPSQRRLQVVLCSATLSRQHRRELEGRRGWVVDPLLLDFVGGNENGGPKAIEHVCVVFDWGRREWRNLMTAEELERWKLLSRKAVEDGVEGARPYSQQKEWEERVDDDEELMIDAVATACKTMGVTRGVLLIDPNVSSARVTEMLRERGVKAGRVPKNVDLAAMSGVPDPAMATTAGSAAVKASPEATGPSASSTNSLSDFFSDSNHILVLPENFARGLDLPFITHVMMLGVPPDPATYMHMSGRVGRFGKPGTAVTFLPGSRFESKMMSYLRFMKVESVKLGEDVLRRLS
ncbi:hypothetical protein HK101_010746, partial [Irineochytrium annulatum]